MISQAALAGGYAEASLGSGTYQITRRAKLHKVTPTAPGVSAQLPPANGQSLSLGAFLFVLWNGSATQTLTLKNGQGSTINTLNPNDVVLIGLYSNTNVAGVWFRIIKTKKGP